MPYYSDIEDLARDVCHWADLRNEQGHDAAAVIREVRKYLMRARSRLRYIEPTADQLRVEPNDLAAIQALRPKGPRIIANVVSEPGFKDRLRGAWLCRAAGCTLGVPVENWSIEHMAALAKRCKMSFPPKDYWKAHPWPETHRYGASTMADYLRGGIKSIPVDDDLAYTVLGLLILEKYGPGFTTQQVAEAWKKYLPMACTAEERALNSLNKGVAPLKAGAANNPFQEWIGAAIRGDAWGYAAAGWPERAAAMAYNDAFLSHRQNGIYGAMFAAATIAAAFTVDKPLDAVRIGLTEIPAESRLAKDIKWALRVSGNVKDWRKARAAVDRRFKGMHPVHTNNNACLTIFGLALGKGDVTRTLGITVAMGLDNDCTAATAGSIIGAVVGAQAVPGQWWKPFRNKTRTYLKGKEWFKNTDLLTRFEKAARKVWATHEADASGGK
ncbi:MAG: ADP-ribosylglycohydrolase family protein [Candidatus Hydrogenedentes bacterium]|nr:ADP-ribosylglycohydrolase family protein [Candidatus Hydrogenedentota bacterium]